MSAAAAEGTADAARAAGAGQEGEGEEEGEEEEGEEAAGRCVAAAAFLLRVRQSCEYNPTAYHELVQVMHLVRGRLRVRLRLNPAPNPDPNQVSEAP